MKYKLGKGNKTADALSRLHIATDAQFLLLSIVSFDFLKQVKHECDNNKDMQTLKQELIANPDSHLNIICINNIFLPQRTHSSQSNFIIEKFLTNEFHDPQLVNTRVLPKHIAS